ncbi:MAG: hypothetical protein LC799_29515, partial [Actinobacteria bacterium]|nr:hypothetical protein [Actinomycetota bacterium]
SNEGYSGQASTSAGSKHLQERDVLLSASGVRMLLVRYCLGRRHQRVAALAQITAAGTGLVTDAPKDRTLRDSA